MSNNCKYPELIKEQINKRAIRILGNHHILDLRIKIHSIENCKGDLTKAMNANG